MHDRPPPSGAASPKLDDNVRAPQEPAARERRPLLHPLAATRLRRLTSLLIEHGGISRRYAHQLAIIYAGGILRLPGCVVEHVRVARRIQAKRFSPPPIFIIGHWRSGTTFLHNLLSRDPQFCFPTVVDALRPYEFLPGPLDFITRMMVLRSLPATRPMDDIPLNPDLPQEDELALATMGAPSFFHCFYFPKTMSQTFATDVLFRGAPPARLERWRHDLRYYLAKLSIHHNNRRLLLKNPAHSARLADLLRMFPDAAFIHIHRDPQDVLPSTRKLYRTVLPLLALQDYDLAAVERHIAWSYPALMDALFAGLAGLPSGRYVEITYDDLVRDPLATVEGIYKALDLQGFGGSRMAMQSLVRPVGTIPARIDDGDSAFGEAMKSIVAPYRRRLGYGGLQQRSEPSGIPPIQPDRISLGRTPPRGD